ncbi:unnamed protein product [Candidula unifasciata]|uniref:Uncharacterized protein n=1 Tax=Candidula unifasciata TaxID=100452 RepID=A0A8S3YM39_9EUPU|nr:unnamed protein product [Candidula unifasciata]
MSFLTNGSNTTNTTSDFKRYSFIPSFYSFREGSLLFISIVGTAMNLWFLAAILSSPVLRSRLRNKILCNSFLLHVVNCAIILPINFGISFSRKDVGCALISMFNNVDLMQDFVDNWLLVIIIVIFIAQIQDFDLRSRFSDRTIKVGTVALLVVPWLSSLVVVPVIIKEHLSDSIKDCLVSTLDALEVLRAVDTALPIILAILLVIAAAVMKHCGFTLRNSPVSTQSELLNRGPEIDNTRAYVVAVTIATLCDLLRLIRHLKIYNFSQHGIKTLLYAIVISGILVDLRSILTPIAWLLLPDIRERIRTWRPWHRPAPGIDVTMTYKKERN